MKKLQLTPDFVLYTLQDQIEPKGWFEINVDLHLPMTPLIALASLHAMPAHRRRKLSLAMKALADQSDSCIGGDENNAEWIITRQTMGGTCRIQNTNELIIGVKIYGPDTLENCRAQLERFKQDGTCQ